MKRLFATACLSSVCIALQVVAVGSAAAQTATVQASQMTAMLWTHTASAGAAMRRLIEPAEARALWDDPQIKRHLASRPRTPGISPRRTACRASARCLRKTPASFSSGFKTARAADAHQPNTLSTIKETTMSKIINPAAALADTKAAPAVLDFATIKSRQQAAWSSGDYAVVGTTLQIVGEQLCEALDLRFGQSVLDVAAGNGNVTLAAARRGGEVTSTDYVPALLERGRARAAAEGFSIVMQEADAEALPFADASFDVVVSTFGVMFTPNQDKAAAELLRVCKPGGKIGLANWTPEGFIGQLFKTIGKHMPPPAGVKSPALVGHARAHDRDVRRQGGGDRDHVAEFQLPLPLGRAFARRVQDLLRAGAEDLRGAAGTGSVVAARRSPGARRNIQPVRRCRLVVPSEYLEIVITKR